MPTTNSRNTQIIAKFSAGNTDKTQLAQAFGVSVSTIRRVLATTALAGVVMVTAAAPNTAQASLTGTDKTAADNYFANHPEIVQAKPQLVTSVYGAGTLQQANDVLKGNSYYTGYNNGNTVLPIPMIDPVQAPVKPTSEELRAKEALTADNIQRTTSQHVDAAASGNALVSENVQRTADQHIDGQGLRDLRQDSGIALLNGKVDLVHKNDMDNDVAVNARVDGVESTANHALHNTDAALKENAVQSQAIVTNTNSIGLLNGKTDAINKAVNDVDTRVDGVEATATSNRSQISSINKVNVAQSQFIADNEKSIANNSHNIQGVADQVSANHHEIEAVKSSVTDLSGVVANNESEQKAWNHSSAQTTYETSQKVDANTAALSQKIDKSTYTNDKIRQLSTDSEQDSGIVQAQLTADTANTKADQNSALAENAQNSADQAQTTADQGVTDAARAQNAANTATTKATTAQTTADGVAAAQQGANARENIRQGSKYQAMVAAANDATKENTAKKSVPVSPLTATTHQQTAAQTVTSSQPAQKVRSAYYDQQLTELNGLAEQDHAEVLAESHSRAAGDASTLKSANDYTNSKFSDLKSQVDDNKKEAAAGSASAMAQANIPQVQESQQFAIGAGVGGYDSQQGLAVGASFHASRSTIVKMSVSDDSQSNFGYGAGVSVGW